MKPFRKVSFSPYSNTRERSCNFMYLVCRQFLMHWRLPRPLKKQNKTKPLCSPPHPPHQGICSSQVETLLLLLLSHFSRVQLCVTPETAAHQAPRSLGFSRQEHWSGLPFPSPMHESEKWKWSCSVVSDPQRPHGVQPTRLLHPWDFLGKSTGVGCHCLLQLSLRPWNLRS